MSMMRRPSFPPIALRRTVLAVFALALLLPGLLDQHGHGGADAHRVDEAGVRRAGAAYFPAAAHPDLPLHLEDAEGGEVRPCTVCLQSFQSRGTTPDRASFTVPPAPRRPLPAVRPVVPARRWAAVAAGRAPPLS